MPAFFPASWRNASIEDGSVLCSCCTESLSSQSGEELTTQHRPHSGNVDIEGKPNWAICPPTYRNGEVYGFLFSVTGVSGVVKDWGEGFGETLCRLPCRELGTDSATTRRGGRLAGQSDCPYPLCDSRGSTLMDGNTLAGCVIAVLSLTAITGLVLWSRRCINRIANDKPRTARQALKELNGV